MFLVLGFRGAWVSHALPRVPKECRPCDAALPPGSGSRLARSPAWHGLPQCPGYGHWVSYCCVAFVLGSGLCLGSGFGNPASPGWGLRWVWVPFVVLPLFSPLGFSVFAVGLGFRPTPHLSWLGVWDVRGCVRALPAPRCPGSGVWCGRACWGPGFGCSPPLLGEVLGCVCACVHVPRGLLHLLVGCAVRGCVVGPGLLPRPATPGWVVRACVFVCAPRLYPAFPGWAVLCGRTCWARVLAVPRPSWLGCWGVCADVRVPRLPPPLLGGRLWRGCVRVLPLPGLPPPPPLWFSFGGALWCLSLVVPVLGIVVSVPPSLLSRAAFLFSFCPSVVCVRVFWVSLLPLGRCPRLGVAGFGWKGPWCPFGGSCLRCRLGGGFGRLLWCGWAVWWLWAVLPPPPRVFFWAGSACSSLCLPWAGAGTGRHSVWSSGLLLVVVFCQAVPRPHWSGELCTR